MGSGWVSGEDTVRPRIFDHFTGDEAEDARFSKVARQMQRSPGWLVVPMRDEPAAVNGEIATGPVALLDREISDALAVADRKERCLHEHGYGCARPECGRAPSGPIMGLLP